MLTLNGMGLVARAAALALLALCLPAGSASAATFVVTNPADAPDNNLSDGVCAAGSLTNIGCTLRAAVQQANASPTVADEITVPAGTYNLTQPVPVSAPDDSGGDLDITSPVTINGAGARSVIVDQQVPDRVFEVSGLGAVFLRGLTITGGASGATQGAGIFNQGDLTVENSTIRGNSGAANGGGISNDFSATLVVDHSQVSGNVARGFLGGGIYTVGSSVQVSNSTLSGNQAENGSAIATHGVDGPAITTIQYSTTTANESTTGAALANIIGGDAAATGVRDSIVATNAGTGTDCSGVISSAGYNIESGTSCNFGAAGDKQNTNPQLGPLADNGGPTNTHLPADTSPAVDAGNPSGCPATDQRGVTRPIGPLCDIGAVEVSPAPPPPPPPPPTPASLTFDPATADRRPGDPNLVIGTVLNNDGSPAAGASVRYSIQGPNGEDGAIATGPDGRGQISWEGVHEGTDTLTAYVDTNGNLTPEANEPTGQAAVIWALPAPRPGRTTNLDPISGIVRITIKGAGKGKVGAAGATSRLTEAQQVPLDTVVDVRRGRVEMTNAANAQGGIQKAQFYGGVYTTRQPSVGGGRRLTELRLTESLICQPNRRGREVTASRARSRRLWGRGRGRYRTRGRYSTATVRGTIWLQKDTCTKTTTVVREGVVDVRDLAKRRTVRIRAGGRYVARRASRRR